ncbi:hypothetical protein Bca52824_076005 [Brassica carinata]|uniref:Uncharacterized protein n=1 Tax=Brassica carinata TaxID=52824 RepID=A0A8X7TX32_BRACI|nr:hypothetical protein Bca52824_076005 [Brassica carinata]
MQDSPEDAPLSPHQPPSPLPNATVAIPGREAAVRLDDCLKYCIVAGKKALESSGLGGWFIVKVNVFSHEIPVASSLSSMGIALLFQAFLGDVSRKGSGLSKGLLCEFRGFGSRLAVSAK